MLVKLSSDKTVSETAATMQAAVQANRFGVMQVHNLKETRAKKGVELASECLIFAVCQPQQAKKVLDENMSITGALPCRISIYEEGGKTILVTLKPTTLLAMFDTPHVEGSGAGSGSRDCQNFEGSRISLIGWHLMPTIVRSRVTIARGYWRRLIEKITQLRGKIGLLERCP